MEIERNRNKSNAHISKGIAKTDLVKYKIFTLIYLDYSSNRHHKTALNKI